MAPTITVRHLHTDTIAWIMEEAGASVRRQRQCVRRLILRGLEAEHRTAQPPIHHDLDDLAGTWSAEEAEEILSRAVSGFDQVDLALWQLRR